MPDDAALLVDDLFRRESASLVSTLTRLLGPSNLQLAEDVVQEALIAAMQAWRFSAPRDPRGWILQTAKHRAIDHLRRSGRHEALASSLEHEWSFVASEDAANQLAMMFSICDESLSQQTHVSLILRLLCGLSAAEIGRAFLVDTQTIDRRLHRGRARLQALGRLHDVSVASEVAARQPSVLQSLYLLFNEGYHGSDADNPLHPGLCAEAIRLVELLAGRGEAAVEAHALAAFFCLTAARLPTRLDADGVFVPLAEQERAMWNHELIARGLAHLSASAEGGQLSRWHLEAGIACEHAIAGSVAETNWAQIVELYDALMRLTPGPIVAMNRALAIGERSGLEAGRAGLVALREDPLLAGYSFYWAALADIERRAGRSVEARGLYEHAISLARSGAEKRAYQRRVEQLVT